GAVRARVGHGAPPRVATRARRPVAPVYPGDARRDRARLTPPDFFCGMECPFLRRSASASDRLGPIRWIDRRSTSGPPMPAAPGSAVMSTTEVGGSVTRWIRAIKRGADSAAPRLWERYFDPLVRLAKARLGRSPRRVADEEDVALSALNSFVVALRDG